MPQNSMSFSAFCANLRTPLKVVRSSWCAYAPDQQRAVFTVWADLLIDGRYLFWRNAGAPHHQRQGAKELKRVLDAVMQTNHETLGILCYAKDPKASQRKRARYIEETLQVIRFVAEPVGIVGYVVGEVTTEDALRGRIGGFHPVQSAIDDLNAVPPGVDNPGRQAGGGGGYRRDDAVRAYVIQRAKGRCEFCGEQDFLMSSGKHYLEAHHIIRLADQGPDRPNNVIALCSSHHRQAHYGVDAEQLEELFQKRLATIESPRTKIRLTAGNT